MTKLTAGVFVGACLTLGLGACTKKLDPIAPDPDLVEALESFRSDTSFWQSLAEPDVSAVEPPDRVLLADLSADAKKEHLASVPLKRFARPEEVAYVVRCPASR